MIGRQVSGAGPHGNRLAVAAAQSAADDARPRRSPWIIGIVIGFALVVLVNAGFIYLAVKGADTVVPSYHTEGR
jgi:hypothetical protein